MPVPRKVINRFTGALREEFERDPPAKTSRSDSATNSLNEQPRWSAASRACLNRPSGTFTVVLMHHGVAVVHHDVNGMAGTLPGETGKTKPAHLGLEALIQRTAAQGLKMYAMKVLVDTSVWIDHLQDASRWGGRGESGGGREAFL
jgi:hypothetical protein